MYPICTDDVMGGGLFIFFYRSPLGVRVMIQPDSICESYLRPNWNLNLESQLGHQFLSTHQRLYISQFSYI